ncbi:hypothetical protein PU634_03890 [Oceanimonas pelagia]|uniref:O-antigen ligase domain-containing protein n=1 Tax=Oceanimonas pelagia TaxID=3028314 RepID=A0AA50KR33_9GAMM|nr:hypothetical protein [Oceanimonas pelagia]WMC11510.1 hypothetical protein PU634_03890 [Oceanimonas pelagia]
MNNKIDIIGGVRERFGIDWLEKGKGALLLAFVIGVSVLGNIKLYIGSPMVWLILLAPIFIYSLLCKRLSVAFLMANPFIILIFMGWLIFVSGIALAGWLHDGKGVYTIIKYLVIMLVLLGCILIQPTERQLEFSLYAGFVVSFLPLLILMLTRKHELLVILGDGRAGWYAAWPGVVWKTAALIWPMALWSYLNKRNWRCYLLVASSMLVVSIDGSRTAMLWMALTYILFFLVFCLSRHWPGLRPGKHIALLSTFLVVFLVLQPSLLSWVNLGGQPALLDVTELSGSTIDRVAAGNTSTRMEMLYIGWMSAIAEFPFGAGFGQTVALDAGVPTVIHMTYLQLLADTGVLGLTGYLAIFVIPLIVVVRFIVNGAGSIHERIGYVLPASSGILLYLFSGLFHPVSNELMEWMVVLLSIAVVITRVPYRN